MGRKKKIRKPEIRTDRVHITLGRNDHKRRRENLDRLCRMADCTRAGLPSYSALLCRIADMAESDIEKLVAVLK